MTNTRVGFDFVRTLKELGAGWMLFTNFFDVSFKGSLSVMLGK